MLNFPNFDPVLLEIGPISIRWYGFMYIVGFFIAWILGTYRAKKLEGWNKNDVTDLIFYSAWGTILGGRLGYFVFYKFGLMIEDPFSIFRLWEGGMSFHGGVIGVFISLWIYHRRKNRSFATVADFLVPLAPLALGIGRVGNFLNGELWGRVTTVPWGMVFPTGGPMPRHPSQLYEAFLEGVVLFFIVWFYSNKIRKPWAVTSVFLIGYGLIRFLVEFFRQPDLHLGFVAFNWMTQGQLLSVIMVCVGVCVFGYSYCKEYYFIQR